MERVIMKAWVFSPIMDRMRNRSSPRMTLIQIFFISVKRKLFRNLWSSRIDTSFIILRDTAVISFMKIWILRNIIEIFGEKVFLLFLLSLSFSILFNILKIRSYIFIVYCLFFSIDFASTFCVIIWWGYFWNAWLFSAFAPVLIRASSFKGSSDGWC